MNEELYTLWVDGQNAGPYTFGQIKLMWASGTINAKTLYWTEGKAEWKPLLDIARQLENAQAAPSLSTTGESSQKNLQKKTAELPRHPKGNTVTVWIWILLITCAVGAAALVYHRHSVTPRDFYSLPIEVTSDYRIRTVLHFWSENTVSYTVSYYALDDLTRDNHRCESYRMGKWKRIEGNDIHIKYNHGHNDVAYSKSEEVHTKKEQTYRWKNRDLLLIRDGDNSLVDSSLLFTRGFVDLVAPIDPAALMKQIVAKVGKKNSSFYGGRVGKYDEVAYDITTTDSLVSPLVGIIKFHVVRATKDDPSYIDRDIEILCAFEQYKWVPKKISVNRNGNDYEIRNFLPGTFPKSYSFSYGPIQTINTNHVSDWVEVVNLFTPAPAPMAPD